MGDSNRQVLAMNVLMRCADIDATRDLDRAASGWSALEASDATGMGAAVAPIQARPAA